MAWFGPTVLAQTASQVLLSIVFERFADKREVEGFIHEPVIDDLKHGEELWFDYVSDVGDGFDATATVAHVLAKPSLELRGSGGEVDATPPGSLLVLGGDEVYPYASMRAYSDRTVGPYRAVFPYSDPPHPTLLAIPGNHDWYDGLTAFLRVFGAPALRHRADGSPDGPWIGGWRTLQRRSYFAAELPHRWWLWGIDIQLDTYIDSAQLEYFRAAAGKLQPDDGVILCCAKPAWMDVDRTPEAYKTLDFFERRIIGPTGAHVRLTLAGDQHAYVRYEARETGEQKIMAGGGGAYLAATHHFPETLTLPRERLDDEDIAPAEFTIGRADDPASDDVRYPSAAASSAEARQWIRILWRNGIGLPALVATAYALWSVSLPDSSRDSWQGVLAAVVTVVVFVALTKLTKEQGPKSMLGVAHAAVQTLAVAALTYALRPCLDRWWAAIVVGLIGALVGCMLFAAYLFVADRWWEVNTNELFAAQRIERYKCFVRLHIGPDGDLVVRTVGMDDVCRRWGPPWPGDPYRDRPPLVAPHEPVSWRIVDGPLTVPRRPGPMT